MAKDPAFLYYDADVARDTAFMNRIEKGCYLDLIQCQRTYGKLTLDLIKRILGTDFELCWGNIEIVLTKDEEFYFIGWVKDSTEKRKKFSESQKNRIQSYWDKKNNELEEPRNDNGISVDIPFVNENENENEIKKEINTGDSVERGIDKPELPKHEKENVIVHTLQKFVKEKFPNVSKMKQQLTFDNCEDLVNKFSKEIIAEVLEAMENYVGLQKKYVSVNLTLRQWIKRRDSTNTKITPKSEQKFNSVEDIYRNAGITVQEGY